MHHNRLNDVEPDIEAFVCDSATVFNSASWAELGETIRRLAGELIDEIATDPESLTIALLLVGGCPTILDDGTLDDGTLDDDTLEDDDAVDGTDGECDFPFNASWN